jgi:putative intracellular protease/amidase
VKVLIVVARRFNGHELWVTLGVLQKRGLEFEVISKATNIEDEVTHERGVIDRTLDEVKSLEGFDALMVVSGNMKDTEAYWWDIRVLDLVWEAHKEEKPIAAICCSVPTIRFAAKGKKVSYFPLIRSADLLERAGAILQGVMITVDGDLVTAEHQMATETWAETFASVVLGEEVSLNLTDSGFRPGKSKLIKRLPREIERAIYPPEEFERLQELDRQRGKRR